MNTNKQNSHKTTEHITHCTVKKTRRYAWEITIHRLETWENPETLTNETLELTSTYTLTDSDYTRMMHIISAMERASVYGDAIEIGINRPKRRA